MKNVKYSTFKKYITNEVGKGVGEIQATTIMTKLVDTNALKQKRLQ